MSFFFLTLSRCPIFGCNMIYRGQLSNCGYIWTYLTG